MTPRRAVIIAGVLGLIAVLTGTFAAHGLEDRVAPEDLHTWEVAVRYQMYHALALLALAGWLERLGKPARIAAWCWTFGAIVFAGSLYLLVLTGQRWLGAITPIGGVGFIVGWACVIVAGVRMRKPAD